MFCPNCGKELPTGAAFCGGCGTKIGEAKNAASPSQNPAPAYAAPAPAPAPTPASNYSGNKIAAAVMAAILVIVAILPIIFWFGDNVAVDLGYEDVSFSWNDIYEHNDEDMMFLNIFRITSVVLLSVGALLSIVAVLTNKYGITFVNYAGAIVSIFGAMILHITCRDNTYVDVYTTFAGVMFFICCALLIILPIIIMCVAPRRVVAYTGAAVAADGTAPVLKLNTSRSLLKYILLSLITFGIYGIVVMSEISTSINQIASRNDGRKTMHYCLVYFLFSWLTYGIVPLVWCHNLSDRIGCELRRRGYAYPFGAGTFWGWGFFGSLIVVGPFIYYHKLFHAMNMISADYNVRG